MFVGIIILNVILMVHYRLALYEAQPVVGRAAKQQNGKQKLMHP